jgi:regulator of protease activity HflC (stomatin/prohibitin superfamily)
MPALTWLNDLVQWLGRWVPRLVLVEPTHRGVLFGPKGSARECGPGLVLYWPITHALTLVAVTTQSVQINAQALPLKNDDGGLIPRVLLCAAAVQFRVDDPVAFATKALHAHALVDNRTQAAIARHRDEYGDDRLKWIGAARLDLVEELAPFGFVIERLDITQSGTGMALKNVSDWSYSDSAGGKRPE